MPSFQLRRETNKLSYRAFGGKAKQGDRSGRLRCRHTTGRARVCQPKRRHKTQKGHCARTGCRKKPSAGTLKVQLGEFCPNIRDPGKIHDIEHRQPIGHVRCQFSKPILDKLSVTQTLVCKPREKVARSVFICPCPKMGIDAFIRNGW